MSDNKLPPEIFTIQFGDLEVDALIEVLKFANTTATMLAQQELTKGGTIKGAALMNRIASDSKELMRIVSLSVDIGEPETNEFH
jgi:hypothetical protein